MDNNKLVIVSGHSGSGKTTLMRSLMNNELVSFTTREKREGEIDGVDYHFISVEEYEKMLNNDELVEQTKYSGNYYGLSKKELETKLKEEHAYIIVDYNGMEQLKKFHDNCVTILLHTSKEDAMKQMLNRGDSAENVEKRLKTYHQELAIKQFYDYCVINKHGKFEETRFILNSILQAELGLMEAI